MIPVRLSRLIARVTIVPIGLIIINTCLAQNSSQFDGYRNALIGYFSENKLIPIMVSRGQMVGDVFDAADLRLLARASKCFPELKVDPPIPSEFVSTSFTTDATLVLSMGMKEIIDIQADASRLRSMKISFNDVTVSLVPVSELKRTYSASECPELEKVIGGKYDASSLDQAPIVVGEVYYGKRTIEFVDVPSATGKLSLETIQKVLKRFGVSVSSKAELSGAGGKSFRIESDNALPIAIRPAFIPMQYTGTPMGDNHEKIISRGYTWEEFDPASFRSHREAFEELSKRICINQSCLEGF